MATRTPHTGVAGEVLTAANLAKYPKGWIGRVSETGPVVVDTSDDVLLSIAVTVGSDRMIRIYAQGTVGMARWSIDGESNSGIFFAPAFGVIVPVTARVGVKGQIDFYLVKWNDDFDDGNLVRYFIGIAIDMNR